MKRIVLSYILIFTSSIITLTAQIETDSVEFVEFETEKKHSICYTIGNIYSNSYNYEKAYYWYLKAANNGHAPAQYELGNIYYSLYKSKIYGVENDDSLAQLWFTKAAEQGYANGQVMSTVIYFNDSNYKEAFFWIKRAVTQEYIVAEQNLSFFYRYGFGVKQDFGKAVYWFKKASEKEYFEEASDNISNIFATALQYYQEGEYEKSRNLLDGIKQDLSQPLSLRQIDTNIFISAYKLIGDCYFQEDEHVASSAYYLIAIELINKFKRTNLFKISDIYDKVGDLYMKNGEQKLATDCYRIAANQKLVDQQITFNFHDWEAFENSKKFSRWYTKGNKFYYLGQYKRAFNYFEKAALHGGATGQYRIGLMYMAGKGVDKDYGKAFYSYEKSAKQGHPGGQANLAGTYYVYSNYLGIDANNEMLVFWLKQASQQEHPVAQEALAFGYFGGIEGLEKDFSKGVYWLKKSLKKGSISEFNGLVDLKTAYNEAWLLFTEENYNEAIRVLEETGYESIDSKLQIVDTNLYIRATLLIASCYLIINDNYHAVAYFEIADELFEKLKENDPFNGSKKYYKIGLECQNWDAYDLTLKYYLKAYNNGNNTLNDSLTTLLLRDIGNTFIKLHDCTNAVRYYNGFLFNISKFEFYEYIYDDLLSEIGRKLYFEKAYEEALEFLLPSVGIKAHQGIDNKHIVDDYSFISSCFYNLDEHSNALLYDFRRLEIYQNDSLLTEFVFDCYSDIASNYKNLRDTVRSDSILTLAVSLKKKGYPDFKNYSEIADLNYEIGNYKIALEYYERCLPLAKEIFGKKSQYTGLVYSDIGYCQLALGNHSESLLNLDRALKLYLLNSFNDSINVMNLHLTIGQIYFINGNYNQALFHIQESHSLAIQLYEPDNIELASIKNSLSSAYIAIQRFDLADTYINEALEIYTKLNITDNSLLATLYNNKGLIYMSKNNLQQAFHYIDLALQTGMSEFYAFPELESHIYLNLGTLYGGTGNYDQAILYLEKLLKFTDSTQYNQFTFEVYSRLGLFHLYSMNFERALYFNNLTLGLIDKAQRKLLNNEVKVLTNLIWTNSILSKDDQAMNCLNQVAEIIHDTVTIDPVVMSYALNCIGSFSFKAMEFEMSKEFFELSNKFIGKGHPFGNVFLIDNYYKQSMISFLNQDFEKSVEYISKSLDLIESNIFQNVLFLPNDKKETSLFTIHECLSFYLLFTLINETDDNHVAFEKYLKFKKLSLNSEVFVREIIKNANDSKQDYLYDQLRREKQKLNRYIIPNIEQNSSDKQVDSLTASIDILEMELISRNTNYGYFKQSFEHIFDSIKVNLNEEEACIEYVALNIPNIDSVYYFSFIVRKEYEKPIVVGLFEESQLRSFISKHASIKPDAGRYNVMYNHESNGSELYNLCWAPLDSLLIGIKTVYVSSSGLLHNISMSILPLNKDSILSDKYEFHYVSSISELSKVKAPSPTISDISSVTMYSNISYDSSTYSVDNTERKIPRPMANQSYGTWTELYYFKYADSVIEPILPFIETFNVDTGYAASKQSFFDLDGNSSDIIHFFTHGFYYPSSIHPGLSYSSPDLHIYTQHKNPLYRTGLVMSGGNIGWQNGTYEGILTAMEILPLDLSNTDLVILSACVTGLGDIEPYEGVYGLQRAFKIAGVDNIIMTLWPVYDSHTKVFFEHFYINLSKDQSVHDAFYNAQNTMRSKVGIDHWGGFVLLE